MARKRRPLLSDQQWAKIEPLLPPLPAQPQGGRPWCDHRSVLEGILRVLKTGARWRDLGNGSYEPELAGGREALLFSGGTALDEDSATRIGGRPPVGPRSPGNPCLDPWVRVESGPGSRMPGPPLA